MWRRYSFRSGRVDNIPLSTPALIPPETSSQPPPSYVAPGYTPEAAPPPYTPAQPSKHEASSHSPHDMATAAGAEAQAHSKDGWRRRSWRLKICGIPYWFIFVLMCGAAIVGGALGYRAAQARKNPRTIFAPDYWYTISDDESTQPQYLIGGEAGQGNVSMIKPETSSDVDDMESAHWQIRGPLKSLGDLQSSCFDDSDGKKRDLYWIMNRAGGQDFHLCFKEALFTPEAIRNRNSTSEVLELELSNQTFYDGVKQRTGMWYFDKGKADGNQPAGESFRINNCASREDWILGWDKEVEPWRPVMVRAERKSGDMWWRVWKLFAQGQHAKIEDEGWSADRS